ncbi:hypothetical protein HY622_03290 [Candidatus Uhrbacteria bacterium]|nr:hypothetical protein [Candidatus Uhrbacteria bacterium]
MSLPFAKLSSLADASLMPQKERNAFLSFFAHAPQEDIEAVVRYCQRDSHLVDTFWEFIKRKQGALRQGDWKEWYDILARELREIEKLNK